MNDKYFADSNILVYANDKTDAAKQQIAKDLIIKGIKNDLLVISTQVLSEFYVTVTKKIKKTLEPEAALLQIKLLKYVDIIEIDVELIIQAITISQKHSLSYWDSLIVAAAINAKTAVLYSEDMNHGQNIESLKIINPFIL